MTTKNLNIFLTVLTLVMLLLTMKFSFDSGYHSGYIDHAYEIKEEQDSISDARFAESMAGYQIGSNAASTQPDSTMVDDFADHSELKEGE